MQLFTIIIYSFYSSKDELEHWIIENLFLKLKTKLRLYHVEHRKPKKSSEKIRLFLVETQQLPDIEKVDSKDEFFCLKWTVYNDRRKVCMNFQIDTDKVNIVVYWYQNSTYLKGTEMELKLTDYEKLLAKCVHLLSYIDIFFKRFIVLDETTVQKWFNICREWTFSFF